MNNHDARIAPSVFYFPWRRALCSSIVFAVFSLFLRISECSAQNSKTAATVKAVGSLIEQGLADSALIVLQKAVAVDTGNVDLLLALAGVQKAKRQPKARRATLEKVLRIQPVSIEAPLAIAQDLFNAQKLDSAQLFAHEALENSEGRSAEAHYWLGRIHQKANRPDSALYYYQGAWEALPWGKLF